jgi:hypothetical protein
MKIVIMARTRMYGGKVCIGGMSHDGGSFRLMNVKSEYHPGTCPYTVGETWEMAVQPCAGLVAPHLEDVAITNARMIGKINDLRNFVLERIKPWEGGIGQIFDGKIRFTGNGSGYISKACGLPSISTGFWVPDNDLEFSDSSRPSYSPHGDYRYLSYVGTASPQLRIPGGTLVRISLAKWWKPRDADESLELRCYAQLSGWF